MKIIVAKNAGFCMGVRRALEMAMDRGAETKQEIVTFGPLIHNPQVVELLSLQRIRSSRELKDFREGTVGFISAHGISPEVRERLQATGSVFCDASCPDVLKVQGLIKKHARRGYATVIFGDRGHSEVEGLLGFSEGRGHVVGSLKELAALPDLDRVCLVSQTTQDGGEYERIISAAEEKFKETAVCRTICASTVGRQEELREIAGRVDALVVVGGKNSANTARLARIAEEYVPVFQVETADELDMEKLGEYRTVGVAAGASTPNWLIQGVVDRLRDRSWEKKWAPLRRLYAIFSFVVKANLFIAFGGACLTFASMRLMGLSFRWLPPLLSFCYVLALYSLNIVADQSTIRLNQPSRYRLLQRHGRTIKLFIPAGILAALGCSVALGLDSFLLALFVLLLGIAYSFKILPSFLPWRRLKDISGSKELFSSLGWGTLAVLIPAFSAPLPGPAKTAVGVAFVFVFVIMFVLSTLFDIRDMQGDRLVGRGTIPVIIGKEKTKLLLGALTSFLALLLIVASIRGWVPYGYYYLIVIAYAFLYLFLYHRRVVFRGLFHEMLVDGQLVLAGLVAWLAR